MEFIVTGKVIFRGEKRSGVNRNGSSWSNIDYVIEETDARYPKKISFNVFGDERVQNSLRHLRQNDVVTVHCDVDANEYKGKYFNNISAWKIVKDEIDIFTGNKVSSNAPQVGIPPIAIQQVAEQQAVENNNNEVAFGNSDEDVPF